MKRLFSHLKPYRLECVLAPLFKMTEAMLELLVPLVIAAIVDRGIGEGESGYVVKMALLLAALGLVGLLFSVTAQFFAARAAVGTSSGIRRSLFRKIQNLPVPSLDKQGSATMITRMTGDVAQVQSGINMVLRLFLRSPFVVFGAMIMAFTVDVKSALVFAVIIPALAIVVFAVMLITMPLFRRLQGRLDRVVGLARENISGARVIRAFGREGGERESFARESRFLRSLHLFVGRISAITNPLTYVMINLAVVFLLHIGGNQVDTGRLTQGQVIALYNYMSQILVELIKLADLIVTLTRALASGKRIESVLASEDALESFPEEVPDHTCRSHIVFRNVSMTYPGASEPSLSGLDFTIERGETVGIIGGTGSGKSSLVHLIPHFYDVSCGAVLVDGIDTRAYPTEELRSRIGFVLQKAALFSGTIRENMRVGCETADDARMMRALRAAQAEGIVLEKGGLDAGVEQNGRNFSGGQKQRLSIARALVRDPDILILDDSSSALDYATDAALRGAIAEYSRDMTVIMIAQRTSVIAHADKIIVLEDGEIAGIGRHEELLLSCPIYREIHHSQFPDDGKGGESHD